MAKKKAVSADRTSNDDMDELFASLAEETGGDVLADLDSVKFRIDTGNMAINYSC